MKKSSFPSHSKIGKLKLPELVGERPSMKKESLR